MTYYVKTVRPEHAHVRSRHRSGMRLRRPATWRPQATTANDDNRVTLRLSCA